MNLKITLPVAIYNDPNGLFFGSTAIRSAFLNNNNSVWQPVNGVDCQIITMVSLPDIVLRNTILALSDNTGGFDLEWLTTVNEPHIEFPYYKVDEKFSNKEMLLSNDEKNVLMPMYSTAANGARNKPLIDKWEIMNFVNAYATGGDGKKITDGLYDDPLTLEGVKEEYDHGNVC